MTENEAIIQLNFDMEMIRFNPDTGENLTLEQIKAHNEDNYKTYLADELAITALLEVQQYRAIGTTTELQELKENQRKCEDCAGCTNWKCDCANIRSKAIDDAIETAAKTICVGCGYLDGYKCNYKGANCGVSKPMLESVVKALEQMKGGAEC